MMLHTPGPWEAVDVSTGSATVRLQLVADGRGVMNLTHDGSEEGHANARLIAATPDLLTALEECITDDGAHCMTDESRSAASICRRRLDAITAIARAALAKATK